jgi:hypothetical protein
MVIIPSNVGLDMFLWEKNNDVNEVLTRAINLRCELVQLSCTVVSLLVCF